MTTLAFRIQNNRDRFYVHIANDDYQFVKGKRFKLSTVGYSIILRSHPEGAVFLNRWGIAGETEFKYAILSRGQHPCLPLFGPHECTGQFDAAGNVFTTLPTPCLLPWPSRYASKYEFDDQSCEDLLTQRANDLRRCGKNVLTIPDHMVTFIGFERLKNFLLKNPWLEIERDKVA